MSASSTSPADEAEDHIQLRTVAQSDARPSTYLHLPRFRLDLTREATGTFFRMAGFETEWDVDGAVVCIIHNELRVALFALGCIVLFLLTCFIVVISAFGTAEAASGFRKYLYSEGLIVYSAFVAGALFLSFILMRQHWHNWVHPPSQRHLIWILGMVPAYACASYLGLVSLASEGGFSLYVDFLRVSYEALVIYHFLLLLTKYLGGHQSCVGFLLAKPPSPFP